MTGTYPYGSLEYWKKMAETRQNIINRAHRKLQLLEDEYDAVEAELRLHLEKESGKGPAVRAGEDEAA